MKPSYQGLQDWWVASVPAPINDRVSKHVYLGWSPCMLWCYKHFEARDWCHVGEGVFEFRNANDHLMFVLKWS